MDANDSRIRDAFARGFLQVPFERQLANCEHYELTPLFRRLLPAHQLILEAGCGSGRWVGWFARQGWQATGLDWSEALCARARQSVPGATFVVGDMRALPFGAGAFGAVVSLGAVEHVAEGPLAALREYHRVLRPGGVASVTVPFLGPARRLARAAKALLYFGNRARRAARAVARPEWACDLMRDEHGNWNFYQYNFDRRQMRRFLDAAGFMRMEEFVDFREEGILHNSFFLAGAYDYTHSRVRFNTLGRLLQAVVPTAWVGHMLVYVARKP